MEDGVVFRHSETDFLLTAAAVGILYKTLVAQATLLAFVDNFRLITVLAICSVPLVLLLKRVRGRATPGAH